MACETFYPVGMPKSSLRIEMTRLLILSHYLDGNRSKKKDIKMQRKEKYLSKSNSTYTKQ